NQFDLDQARQFGMLEAALERLVERSLFTQEAGAMGLAVSDEMVVGQIHAEPAFRNELGNFDPDLFRRVLAANNLSEEAYLALLRGETVRSLLLGSVTRGATAPTALVEDLYRHRAERRVAETVFLPNDAVPEPGMPDEETLAGYHQDRAVRFTAPEYRALTIASLSAEDLMDEIAVDDEEVEAAFEARREEFRTPERRDLEQVLVQDETVARDIAEAAAAGTPFTEAAAAAGTEPLPLSGMTRGDLLPELAETVFSLPEGAVGDPVQSPLGWHVFRILAVVPASERSFEEVRPTIVENLKRDEAADRVFEVANQLDDELAGGATVGQAAQALGLTLVDIPAVDVGGNTPDAGAVESFPGLPAVLDRAFDLAAGEQSTLIETPEGGYFVVQVNDITPAALRPLDEVRDGVVAAWRAEQRAAAAAEQAEDLAEELRSGRDAAEVAAAAGAQAGRTGPLGREGAERSPVPQILVEQLFELQPGEVASAAAEGGQMIVRLAEVQVPDPAAGEAQVASLRANVEQAITTDIMAQYAGALRQRYDVEVHGGVIDQMYLQN
ncbi:MAG TPA: peptidyl-prolyl cis-trans isomerase, partial [Arenibaculum sp.]|nr:peptidyl-prolyl cis-trans isomerase [Arenibaculum sp.]